MKRQPSPAVVFMMFIPAILAPLLLSSHRFWVPRASGGHQSIAPWDYPDEPNPNRIASPGPLLPEPKNVVHVKDDAVTEPDGFSIRLDHISKGNTANWLHWWTPEGGPILKKPKNPWYDQEDRPPLKAGRQRELSFDLKIVGSEPIDYIGYVPDGARSGLTTTEQIQHGWDSTTRIMPFSIRQDLKPLVTVDDPDASRFIVGIARGKWTQLVTVGNTLGKAEPDGQLIAAGPWGTARYAKKELRMAETKHIYGTTIELKTSTDPADTDLRIRGFDDTGAEVPITTTRGIAFIPTWSGRPTNPVKTFTIEERPYTYYEFDGLRYDPDPDQWRNFAWGSNPPSEKVEIGGVTVELRSVSHTEPVTDAYGSRYQAEKIYTPDNRIWRDAPQGWDSANSPMKQPFGRFDPHTGQFDPPESLPQPMLATFMFKPPVVQADEKPVAKFSVFGSNSDLPGKDLHADWNRTNIEWSTDMGMKPVYQEAIIPFTLVPQAKYVQFKFEIASGPWKKLTEVKPVPGDFEAPPAQGFNRTTLLIGPVISMHKSGPSGHDQNRVLSRVKVEGLETRVFARLKDGSVKPLKVTSYDAINSSIYLPGYDFDKDEKDVNRINIDPTQIESFEIETRPIKVGYIVYKPPPDR